MEEFPLHQFFSIPSHSAPVFVVNSNAWKRIFQHNSYSSAFFFLVFCIRRIAAQCAVIRLTAKLFWYSDRKRAAAPKSHLKKRAAFLNPFPTIGGLPAAKPYLFYTIHTGKNCKMNDWYCLSSERNVGPDEIMSVSIFQISPCRSTKHEASHLLLVPSTKAITKGVNRAKCDVHGRMN